MAPDGTKDYAAIADQYARDVVAGTVLACRWVRLACQRHLDNRISAESTGFQWRWDEDAAWRACYFIEQLRHTKGEWARAKADDPYGNLITLEPWQIFVVASIFGWLHKATGRRRYRKAYVCIPRKNGKSILAAGIGLYMLAADGEYGAEVYSGATNQRQALEVFRPAWLMVKRDEELRAELGLENGGTEGNPTTVYCQETGSRFTPVIGKPGDGASPSCWIVDEYHEHSDDTQVDTAVTGMGARENPLLLVITTAGVDTAGPCYLMQQDCQQMLAGLLDDEETFAIVYTVDDGDDWTTEEALRKANPNFGVSVDADFLLSQQKEAIQSSRKQNTFKTKHLNIWCGAREAFFNAEAWAKLADYNLSEEDFRGEDCYLAADLSSRDDLSVYVKMFRRVLDGKAHYYVFAKHYLPEDRIEEPEKQHYQQWNRDGYLNATPGARIDQECILNSIAQREAVMHRILGVAFDPYDATNFGNVLEKLNLKPIEIQQNIKNHSAPMKELDALILDGKVHHTGDPVLAWNIANVTAREDANENVYPRKERDENKIDAAVCCIMALGRWLDEPAKGESIYRRRAGGALVI